MNIIVSLWPQDSRIAGALGASLEARGYGRLAPTLYISRRMDGADATDRERAWLASEQGAIAGTFGAVPAFSTFDTDDAWFSATARDYCLRPVQVAMAV